MVGLLTPTQFELYKLKLAVVIIEQLFVTLHTGERNAGHGSDRLATIDVAMIPLLAWLECHDALVTRDRERDVAPVVWHVDDFLVRVPSRLNEIGEGDDRLPIQELGWAAFESLYVSGRLFLCAKPEKLLNDWW